MFDKVNNKKFKKKLFLKYFIEEKVINMKLIVEKSLTTIDEKISVSLLKNFKNKPIEPKNVLYTDINNHKIWTIDNFFTQSECNEIIASCELNGFKKLQGYDTNFRDNERILVFDKNGNVVETINNRMVNVLKEIYDEEKVKPYGFFVDQYKWSNIIGINECLRISKYNSNSNGFGYHRDAQYTHNNIRFVYTILVYLSDCTDDGQLEFISPNTNYVHCGYTMDQELDLVNKSYETHSLVPKKGMAVIFDQRLIHRAHPCKNTKYALRTDLLVEGVKNISYNENCLQLNLMQLTQKLFRQAQFCEMNELNEDAKNLYEMCISLRQNPQKIKTYPSHLESWLKDLTVDAPIIGSNYTLELITRNGSNYVFKYENIHHKVDIYNSLRICALVLISTVATSLTSKPINYRDYLHKFFPNISVIDDEQNDINKEGNKDEDKDEDDDGDDEEDDEDDDDGIVTMIK